MSKVAKNTAFNLMGQIIPILVALFCIPALIHVLGTSQFGVLTLAWMVVGYFNIFDFGLSRALVKKLAERPLSDSKVPQYIWSTVSFTFLVGLAGGLLLAIKASHVSTEVFRIPADLTESTTLAIRWIALGLPFVVVGTAFRGVLESQQDFKTINLIQAPLGVLNYLLPLLIALWKPSLEYVVLSLIVMRVVTCLVFASFSFRVVPKLGRSYSFSSQILKEQLQFGGWITVSSLIAPIFLYADRFMIGHSLTVDDVAHYVAPLEILMKVLIVPGALLAALFPAFASAHSVQSPQTAHYFQKGVLFLVIFMFPLFLIFSSLAPEGLRLWLGSSFSEKSFSVFQVLCLALFINVLDFVPAALMPAIGRPDLPAKFHLIQLPVFVGALYWGVSSMGLIGAALAVLLRNVLDGVGLFYFSHQNIGRMKKETLKDFAIMVILLLLLSAPLGMGPASARLAYCLGTLAAFSIIVWMYFLDEEDRALLSKLRHKIFFRT